MFDLKAKPFYLDEKQIEWVKNTAERMTAEEKLQQLIIEMPKTNDEEYLKKFVKEQKFGGVRYNTAPAQMAITLHTFRPFASLHRKRTAC